MKENQRPFFVSVFTAKLIIKTVVCFAFRFRKKRTMVEFKAKIYGIYLKRPPSIRENIYFQ